MLPRRLLIIFQTRSQTKNYSTSRDPRT